MNKVFKLFLGFVLLLVLTWPTSALAKGLLDDEVVFGGTFTLESGETLDGSLVVFGGVAELEQDSTVDGDIVLIGGTLQANGLVTGDVIGIGGLITLQEQAVLEGNLVVVGAHLDRAEGARVEGDITDAIAGPLTFTFPSGVQAPRFDVGFSPLFNFTWFTLKLFMWAAVAVLVILFLPEYTERVSSAAINQPLTTGGLGLLSVIVIPPLAIVLTITIIMIPAVLILAVAVALAWAFGMIAVGLEVGKRISGLFNQTWVPAVSAGVGTFVLVLVVNGLEEIIPCVGWVFPALVGMVGFGAVLLTRFGTQSYPLVVDADVSVPTALAPAESMPEEAESSAEEDLSS